MPATFPLYDGAVRCSACQRKRSKREQVFGVAPPTECRDARTQLAELSVHLAAMRETVRWLEEGLDRGRGGLPPEAQATEEALVAARQAVQKLEELGEALEKAL